MKEVTATRGCVPWGARNGAPDLRRRKAMTDVKDIEGIDRIHAKKLEQAGGGTAEALLQKGSTPQGRTDLATSTGISRKLILEWVNLVDLFRIKGVQQEYSDLLEEAGVDTVVELALRNPARLYERMAIVNEEKNLVNKLPSENDVGNWVAQAQKLPRKVHY